jgi:hypothetical protein
MRSQQPSSTIAKRLQNKRNQPKSPAWSNTQGNQQLNQFFSSKKPNQSSSPNRSASAHSSAATATSRGRDNFYQPLQEDMDIDDADAATASSNKTGGSSDDSSSSESSGILHAVTQGDLNNTQPF